MPCYQNLQVRSWKQEKHERYEEEWEIWRGDTGNRRSRDMYRWNFISVSSNVLFVSTYKEKDIAGWTDMYTVYCTVKLHLVSSNVFIWMSLLVCPSEHLKGRSELPVHKTFLLDPGFQFRDLKKTRMKCCFLKFYWNSVLGGELSSQMMIESYFNRLLNTL